jgi:hypothetical protein
MKSITSVNQDLTVLESKRVKRNIKVIFMKDTKPVGRVIEQMASQGSQLRRDNYLTGFKPEPRLNKQLIKAEPIDLLDGWQTKYGQEANVKHTYS